MKKNQFARDPMNRVLLGVAAGLAASLNVDPIIIRLAFVFATLFAGGAGLLIYLVLALIMPERYVTVETYRP